MTFYEALDEIVANGRTAVMTTKIKKGTYKMYLKMEPVGGDTVALAAPDKAKLFGGKKTALAVKHKEDGQHWMDRYVPCIKITESMITGDWRLLKQK